MNNQNQNAQAAPAAPAGQNAPAAPAVQNAPVAPVAPAAQAAPAFPIAALPANIETNHGALETIPREQIAVGDNVYVLRINVAEGMRSWLHGTVEQMDTANNINIIPQDELYRYQHENMGGEIVNDDVIVLNITHIIGDAVAGDEWMEYDQNQDQLMLLHDKIVEKWRVLNNEADEDDVFGYQFVFFRVPQAGGRRRRRSTRRRSTRRLSKKRRSTRRK